MDNKLFVVSNRRLVKGGNLIKVLALAAKGGADAIILREKDLSSKELCSLALDLKEEISDKTYIIINGNLEAAEASAAFGAHFSYEQFISSNRFNGLRGVSVHSLEEGINAQALGADYILAGHIFKTQCKQGLEGRGTSYLAKLCNSLTIPIIAIGGINLSNTKSVLNAGALGIAVMSSVMKAEDPEAVVRELKVKINKRTAIM